MEAKDWKKEYEELQKKAEKLQEDYNRIFREQCDASRTISRLESENEKMINIIERLSIALANQ